MVILFEDKAMVLLYLSSASFLNAVSLLEKTVNVSVESAVDFLLAASKKSTSIASSPSLLSFEDFLFVGKFPFLSLHVAC